MFRKNLCDSKCSLKITSFSDDMIRGLFKTIETHNLTTAGNAKIASNYVTNFAISFSYSDKYS